MKMDNASDDADSFVEPGSVPVKDDDKPETNNLDNILSVLRYFMAHFNSQPLQVDRLNARILDKYPKYLTKFSLLDL